MKTQLLLLASLFLIACSSSDDINLNDNSLLRTVTYDDVTQNEAYVYNDSGLLTRTLLNSNLNEEFQSENGQITQKTKGNLSYKYEYYDDGKLQFRRNYQNNEYQNSYIEYVYEGNLVTATLKDEDGILFDQKTEFILNNNNLVVQKKTYTNNGTSFDVLFDETLEYDTLGNIIKTSVENTITLVTTTTEYEYTSIKNPYYIAFKETYNSIYLDVFYSGYSIQDATGVAPYVLNNESITYKTSNNLPIESINSEDNSKIKYNYY